jgi:hypothetical protein
MIWSGYDISMLQKGTNGHFYNLDLYLKMILNNCNID